MDVRDTKALPPQPLATIVEQLCQHREADRTFWSAIVIGVKDPPNEIDCFGVMLEPLAVLAPVLRHNERPEAERWRLTVPVAPHRIGEHCAAHMLGVLG
ncbi:hypothetical protein ATE59_11470 [Sphingopyxis sp. A083]|nr:hypothetical protein ATE59_11470 [Sphingopyxis sp. A083]